MELRDLSDHVEYRAGRGIEEVARELGRDPAEFVKLSSNENPHGPSPKAEAEIRETASEVHRYPKAVHADLTAALADRWDVADEQVWLANGGDGALDYLARATLAPGDRVLVPTPGFTYYGMSARFHHGEVAEYDVRTEDGFALTPESVLDAYDGERVVYLTSPHNPTGHRFTLDAVEEVADKTDEDTLVVVDEAYGEFTDAPSAVSLLDERDDVAVLRTFSKAFGLAGLRLGYALTPPEWADAYARVQTPFAASAIACRAGTAALADDEHVEQTLDSVEWSRQYIYDELDARTYESHGNFVLANVGDATAVADAAKREGVLIRDCSSFGLPEHVRITCGTREETERAVAVLNEVLAE
ncbi:histidinol-phosphate transaminase [Halobacterium sp. KA-6]|jgi:histidinol-phosphate aminotransferase|uniref:histidinol-phosphate transaminase n=1 Tax=Halobacterium sp. KA-6 TaxID=2896368 RepID=UPI001E4B5D21|nr:histidinol-phosphate transaminase [Halobacterium sp. KA-6]MCD2202661.1 histidinol-phosphate transaminase [Halobacterium sp. KA-6]